MDEYKKIIVPTINKMIKLLKDKESKTKVSPILEIILQSLKAFEEIPKKSKKRWSLSNINKKIVYIFCVKTITVFHTSLQILSWQVESSINDT